MGVLVLFFSSCAIETAIQHFRVIKIPMCKSKLSVTGCGHISYSWPGESRIMPKHDMRKFTNRCIMQVTQIGLRAFGQGQ